MEKDDHDDLMQLRRRLAALTEEARRNDQAWRRAQQREMELLEADTLGELLERLTIGLAKSYRLDAVTLVLADPDHELRQLLLAQGMSPRECKAVSFVDSLRGVVAGLAAGRKPWLGAFARAEHGELFPEGGVASVALLPLSRHGRLIGSLNLGSRERGRFQAVFGTELLERLAVVAAFALENAANRGKLVRSGFTDVLTGWHNRRYLETRIYEELARCARDGSPLTCLIVDVDHFKSVNDRFGHLAGDEVLRGLAERIGAEVRGSDVAARYGGEEFVVLLPNTSIEAGFLLAERIRAAVAARPFSLPDEPRPLPLTVSIGVAEHRPAHGEHDLGAVRDGLLARADLALYEAKAGGRNAVERAANS